MNGPDEEVMCEGSPDGRSALLNYHRPCPGYYIRTDWNSHRFQSPFSEHERRRKLNSELAKGRGCVASRREQACRGEGTNERKSLRLHYIPAEGGVWIPSPDQRRGSDHRDSVSGDLWNFVLLSCHHRSLRASMVSVKISPAGKPLPLARGLPVTVEVRDNAKASDIKVAITAKFPKVGQNTYFAFHAYETNGSILALRVSSKTHPERWTKSLGR